MTISRRQTTYQERPNQEQQILQLLRDAHGGWVALPQVMELGIAQYSARIHGLRKKGYVIENRGKWVDGQLHTWFRLISEPPEPYSSEPTRAGEQEISRLVTGAVNRDDELEERRQRSLFGDISPDRSYRE